MSGRAASRAARIAILYSSRIASRRATQALPIAALPSRLNQSPFFRSRCFSNAIIARAGLMPETAEPKPPSDDAQAAIPTQPTELSEEEYRELSDDYMNAVFDQAEQLQESRDDVEVEYSAGVLTITYPPNGTYVINKQPPNKQIWLSSPLSGPKRYDWVLAGESQGEKEGGGTGEWVYLRDGTNLTSLLAKELGLVIDSHDENMQQSRDPKE